MELKRQFKPLRIGKGLLSLLAMFLMLLAPHEAWATVYTTGTLTDGSGGVDYIWPVEGLSNLNVTKYSSSYGTISVSEGNLNVDYYGCYIRGLYGKGTEKITKVVLTFADSNTNNDYITVQLKGSGSDLDFVPSASVSGEFNLPESKLWSADDELYIYVDKACTISQIKIYTGTDGSTTYSWPDNPVSNGTINGAKQQDGSIVINAFNYQGYYYPLLSGGQAATGVSYGSSDVSVATVASDGSVSIKKVGETLIFASIVEDNNYLNNSYKLTVNFPAPTISPNGSARLSGSAITFSYEGATNQPNFKYKWEEWGDEVSYGQTPPTVKTGTLIGWVEVTNPTNQDIVIKSEEASVVFSAVPQGAYLVVGETAVTDDNCDNVFGDEQAPSVTYDPDTHTLTLNDAMLGGNIASLTDLIVDFKSTNSMSLPSNNQYAFVGNENASLSFKNSGKAVSPLTISNYMDNAGFFKGWKSSPQISNSEEDTWYWVDGGISYCVIIKWNDNSYGLTVAGVEVTSDNASDVLGNKKVSFVQENNVNTLTLDGATIDMSETEKTGIVYAGTDRLVIKLIGTNSITTDSGIEPILYDGTGSITPDLYFEEGSQNCLLTLATEEGTSVIKSFGRIYGVNGIGESKGNWLMLSNGQTAQYSSENGLHTLDSQEQPVLVNSATITLGYGVLVAENLVYADNATNVLNDEETTHKVTWNNDNKTLTLNNAVLDDADIKVSKYAGDVTIEINGTNTINGYVSGDNHKLTVKKVDGAANGTSLTVTGENPVFSFSNIVLGEGLYVNAYSYNGDNEQYESLSNVYFNGQYQTPQGSVPDRITYSGVEPETTVSSIWIGGKEVNTNGTFEGISNVTFNSETKTLTLTNAQIGDLGAVTDIVSNLENLVIELVHNNPEVDQMSLAGSIVSLNPNAELTFKGQGEFFINNSTPISGFQNADNPTCDNKLIYMPREGYYAYVKDLPSPFMAIEQEDKPTLYIDSNINLDYFSGYSLSYIINYVGQDDPVTGTISPEDEGGIELTGPCTVTVTNTCNEKTTTTTGKYYGYENNTLTIAKGQSVDIPELVPACDAEVEYEVAEETIASVADGKITALEVGSTTIYCYHPEEDEPTGELFLGCENLEVTVLENLGLRFYTSENSYMQTGSSQGPIEYRSEYTAPTLKGDTGDGYTADLSGFNITYSSSDPTTATIDETGKITIVGGGFTTIKAESEATETFAADATWYVLKVRPADPDVSISEGAYFTGQKLTLTRVGQSGSMYYSYGSKEASERTAYTGEITLSAGVYDFYPYTRCGTDEQNIWSYGNAHRMLYVYNQPTISKDAGEYVGDIEVEITNLPEGDTFVPTVYYYFDDDEEHAKVYNAGDKITVRESTKLNVYLYLEGDSGKTHKTEVIERQYEIKDIPFALTDDDFHNHWATYYNNNGNVALPEDKTIGVYIASSVGENSVTVTQIKSIPRGVPVLLNNETTTTTDNTSVTGNMLQHADQDIAVSTIDGMVYGLYNGMMKRVYGTISADKNYLLIPVTSQPTGAPQLTIVFDGEENVTGVNNVKNENAEVAGDVYDLQGRKVQKPSKKGLYINKGHKVVINK